MKKNVNMVLLLSIILLTAALIGNSSFHEKRYKNLTKSYNNDMDRMSSELDYFKDSFNTTFEELKLKTSREEGLSSQFMDIKSEKESLAADKDKLTIDLETATMNLAAKSTELVDKGNQLILANNEVAVLTTELDDTKSDLSKARNQRDNYKDILDGCGANCPYD